MSIASIGMGMSNWFWDDERINNVHTVYSLSLTITGFLFSAWGFWAALKNYEYWLMIFFIGIVVYLIGLAWLRRCINFIYGKSLTTPKLSLIVAIIFLPLSIFSIKILYFLVITVIFVSFFSWLSHKFKSLINEK